MNWTEANEAFRDAQRTIKAADLISTDMLLMLVGRLRKTNKYDYHVRQALSQLKKELRDWNSKTETWK